MLLRQKPSSLENYYILNNEKSQYLQQLGFSPLYFYDGNYYYRKSKEIEAYL